jgi:hypothetical protein
MMNASPVADSDNAGLVGDVAEGGACVARYFLQEHRNRPRRMIAVRRVGAGPRNPE